MERCFVCREETKHSYDMQLHLCQKCVEKSIRKWFLKCANCGGWGEEWLATLTIEQLHEIGPIIKEVIYLDTSVVIVIKECPNCYDDGRSLDYLDELKGDGEDPKGYDC